ncbi:hypothetical protein Tco_0646893 [Tanacetum coccineum]
MQRMQKQAKILKENSMNKFNALKTTTRRLERQTFTNCPLFQRAFSCLFSDDVRTFKFELYQHMNNLEKQLKKETLHEKDSKSALSVIKVQFDKFLHLEAVNPSNYDGRHERENFKDYTQIEAQTFKEILIQNMDSIEQCIVERAHHEQEIQNRLKRLNERKLQIQEYKVQEVKASDASLGDTDSSRIISDKGNDQSLGNQSSTYGNESSRSRNECNEIGTSGDDTDIGHSSDTEPIDEDDQNDDHEDERVVLANLITNLKLDINENKKIQKQLRNANTTLTHELKECKSTLEETNRTLGESNRTRDRYLGALHDTDVELAKYKTYHDRTIENDTLERKLKETLGLSAQKEHDIKEGLKIKAYEIFVVQEKNDELVK